MHCCAVYIYSIFRYNSWLVIELLFIMYIYLATKYISSINIYKFQLIIKKIYNIILYFTTLMSNNNCIKLWPKEELFNNNFIFILNGYTTNII